MISLELALAAQAPVHDKAQAPSSAPPQPGPPDSPTRVPARRSERAKCPKRRRSARAPCSTTPKAHRKHTGNTTKTPAHRLVSWRHPRHRGFNPLRFGHTRPNNPRQPPPPARRPTKNNRPPRERRLEAHEQASGYCMLVLTDAAASAHAPVRRRPCSLPSAGSRGRRHWTRPARRCAPADGPISMRNRTDLDASFNRSRCGTGPISAKGGGGQSRPAAASATRPPRPARVRRAARRPPARRARRR